MIFALKIVVWALIGVAVITLAFWSCVILCYLMVGLFESIGKWIK